jgi:predicted helicase
MAPYAVAHMKLGLQLKQSGYDFQSAERLRIYLTNTLEEAHAMAGLPLFTQWIAEEANAASDIKKDAPVMVVLGNPPYSGQSANTGEWISGLLRGRDTQTTQKTGNYFEVDGQPLGEKNPKWLNDDYVKFIRFAQWRIEQTGYGILAFISNNGYLDNPTFRGMRQSLMQTFDDIYILDLHGSSKKKEKAPDGSEDKNVFDIQQGVVIGIFIKRTSSKSGLATVRHSDLWGKRELFEKTNDENKLVGGKYHWLANNEIVTTSWKSLNIHPPYYLFVPTDSNLTNEYNNLWKIVNCMPEGNMGITSGEDDRLVAFTEHELKLRFNSTKYTHSVCYRPFDNRFLWYQPEALARARYNFMQHLLQKENLALVTLRRPRNNLIGNFFVVNYITDKCIISSLDNAQVLPLYIYPEAYSNTLFEESDKERKPNLSPKFIEDFAAKLKIQFIPDGKGDRKKTFGPEDIFNYMYAVFHSPNYRSRYAEFLKMDFPRLPLTTNPELFRNLCALGDELVALHLMKKKGAKITSYPIADDSVVESVRYTEPQEDIKGRIWINATQYFEGVPKEVWEFHIGGYQVCAKWLKDRKARKLTYDDLTHYQQIVSALAETIRIMAKIDQVIDEHGGWPGAFTTEKEES